MTDDDDQTSCEKLIGIYYRFVGSFDVADPCVSILKVTRTAACGACSFDSGSATRAANAPRGGEMRVHAALGHVKHFGPRSPLAQLAAVDPVTKLQQ